MCDVVFPVPVCPSPKSQAYDAIEPSGSVLVHSRERVTTRFRYELRVGGEVRHSAGFTLRPGERREFPLGLGPDERADVRLYRADEPAPYRRLTP